MTLERIKQEVRKGNYVYYKTPNYRVIEDSHIKDRFLIHSQFNDHYIGLTWQDNRTLNGDESDFYLA